MTREEGDLTLQPFNQLIDILMRFGRYAKTTVTNSLIDVYQFFQTFQILGCVKIDLVEDNPGRNSVCLRRDQVPVDESRQGNRIIDCDNQKKLIHVGRNDLTLLGEIGGFTDDVVFAGFNFINDPTSATWSRFILLDLIPDSVAHGNRIGGSHPFHAQLPLDTAVNHFIVIVFDRIPASC